MILKEDMLFRARPKSKVNVQLHWITELHSCDYKTILKV